ncbi:hypothetical protein [Georgenia sp. SYP-B2076]|uniref:hypothetical protein n=1 Tax=Georgenia sp. SYP-B2076 TaxID=2495881 RepID=UPI0013DF30C0|nr:hypothetical protein [Georgenia sp. SYP-B2076]
MRRRAPGTGPARRGAGPRGGGERGQIMLLTLAFSALALVLVLVVASASAVHIERKRLLALADLAAAGAAEAIDEAAYYEAATTPAPDGASSATTVPLSEATVDAAVRAYLAQPAVAGEFDGVRVAEPTGTPDGLTAQVTLTAVARPPLVPWALLPWSEGITLRVTSTARAG